MVASIEREKLKVIGSENHHNGNGNGISCGDKICILDQPQIIPGDEIIVCHFSGCSRGKKEEEIFVREWKKNHGV